MQNTSKKLSSESDSCFTKCFDYLIFISELIKRKSKHVAYFFSSSNYSTIEAMKRCDKRSHATGIFVCSTNLEKHKWHLLLFADIQVDTEFEICIDNQLSDSDGNSADTPSDSSFQVTSGWQQSGRSNNRGGNHNQGNNRGR